jgi:poly-gamma-glutamate capsule biosynthesis protein CapA/YwtB (metallophosphatase superfamily)
MVYKLLARANRPRLLLISGLLGYSLVLTTFSFLGLLNTSPVEAAQYKTGLDTPLMGTNLCGSGLPGEVHFTLAATGDTFPHETIQAVAEQKGYDYLFDRVSPFLKMADLAYTNFDGATLEDSPLSGYPLFNYSPKLVGALKKAGIGVVSTANNHILDRTAKGLDATLAVLERNGILQHGTVPSALAKQPHPDYLPLQLTRNGVTIKIAFLSFSWGTNGNPDYYDQVNLLWASNVYNQQGQVRPAVLDAIAKARRENDFVIVAAHWGYEYNFYPDEVQVEGARQMAAAGADLILGAQPHTLQPVDLLDNGGRKTLVIYSLANFIAAQAFNQQEKFSDTSLIFYVGLIRQPDGKVRVSGYRYLPTMMVENDTRPAPIPAQGYAPLIDHVRQEVRDFSGLHQLDPDQLAASDHLEVCPGYNFKEAGGKTIGGDFSQYFATLGSGTTAHPLKEAVAIVGYPLGPVVEEMAGDCKRTTNVLYTERQRLELQPQADWPFRVVGTQLGTEVYRQRYKLQEVPRLGEEALTNVAFKEFYQKYGGVVVFGYPISQELNEEDSISHQKRNVQYFERARFEEVSGASAASNSDPLYKVQLGLLGREYAGIQAQCGIVQAQPQQAGLNLTGWLAGAGLLLVLAGVGLGWRFRSRLKDKLSFFRSPPA